MAARIAIKVIVDEPIWAEMVRRANRLAHIAETGPRKRQQRARRRMRRLFLRYLATRKMWGVRLTTAQESTDATTEDKPSS